MSKTTDTNIWGIHAGKGGDADSLFLNNDCVVIGWSQMGDLSALKPDREAFKARVAEIYPAKKAGAIPNNAVQLYRFVHEMKPGDWVAYPSSLTTLKRVQRIEMMRSASRNAANFPPILGLDEWEEIALRTQAQLVWETHAVIDAENRAAGVVNLDDLPDPTT